MYWEYLCPNLSFTVERKVRNLHKASQISNSIFNKFQEFISELGKMLSIGKKWNFEPIGNFPHNTKFFTLRNALLILLHLYL